MPTYCYRRRDNNEVVERSFSHVPPKDVRRQIECEDGVLADRDYGPEHDPRQRTRGDLWPLKSDSMGIGQRQVDPETGGYANPEMRRKFPKHKFDPRTGQMIFNSKMHRRQCLKDTGYRDHDSYMH